MFVKSKTISSFHLSLMGTSLENGESKAVMLLQNHPMTIYQRHLAGLVKRGLPNVTILGGTMFSPNEGSSSIREQDSYSQVVFVQTLDKSIKHRGKYLYSCLEKIHKRWQEEGSKVGWSTIVDDDFPPVFDEKNKMIHVI